MNQRRALHSLRKGNHVLRAHYIRAQRALESWVEGDVAGAVKNDVDVVGNSLGLLLGVAKICLADIAAQHDHFVSNESIQRAAVTLTERIEWRRRNHAVPKSRF